MDDLIAGNKRFTSGALPPTNKTWAILKQHTEEKQEPFAAVLSCADSRVPVELVFDQSVGHIFVLGLLEISSRLKSLAAWNMPPQSWTQK
jgi:carbonic anhydrase